MKDRFLCRLAYTWIALVPLFFVAVIFNLSNCIEVRNCWSIWFSGVCGGLMAFGIVLFFFFKKTLNYSSNHQVIVKEICDESYGSLDLFMAYLLPLISINVTDLYSLLCFLSLFLIVALSIFLSRLYSKNVFLNFLGFHLYVISGETNETSTNTQKDVELTILVQKSLSLGDVVSVGSLSKETQPAQIQGKGNKK